MSSPMATCELFAWTEIILLLTRWQGTDDAVYSVANAKEEIKLFTGSPDAKLEVVQGGKHFLSWSHPKEVFGLTAEFVKKYAK